MQNSNKRMILVLLFFLVIFFLIFLLALIDLKREKAVLGIFNYDVENWLVIFLSIISISKVVWELVKIK